MKGKNKTDNEVVLTTGSQYRVKSLESRDNPLITHGEFIGYTAVGHDEGLCMKLDKSHKDMEGRIRIIPLHMIVCIDIIKSVQKEEKSKPVSETMFG